jgi:nicotinate-nucleotide adenylyltransferase
MERVGILGGAFNPVHVGHLRLGVEALEALNLDRVELVPAARPPHKPEPWMLPFALRHEFLRLAVADAPQFCVNPMEDLRPGPSYTWDTLEALAQAHPDREHYFIMGAGDFLNLHLWKRGLELGTLVNLAVAARDHLGAAEVEACLAGREQMGCTADGPGRWRMRGGRELVLIDILRLDISASCIRERFRRGADLRYLSPPPVVEALTRQREQVLDYWGKESPMGAGPHP